jgi:hypothetical protein
MMTPRPHSYVDQFAELASVPLKGHCALASWSQRTKRNIRC